MLIGDQSKKRWVAASSVVSARIVNTANFHGCSGSVEHVAMDYHFLIPMTR